MVDLQVGGPRGEVDELVGLDVGQGKRGGGGGDLVGFLGVDDPGGAVGQDSLGQRDGFEAGGADGAEVGDPVHDGEVRHPESAGQLPLGLHPADQGEVAQRPPGLVAHDEPSAAA